MRVFLSLESRYMQKKSIRMKLLMINIVLIINVVLFVFVLITSTGNLVRENAISAERALVSSQNYISNYMYNYKMIATNVAQNEDVQAFLLEEEEIEKVIRADRIRELMRALQVVRTEITSISLIRRDGSMIGTEGYIWKLSRGGVFDKVQDGFSNLNRTSSEISRQYYSLSVFHSGYPREVESIGTVVISFDTKIYMELFGISEENSDDLFFITDREGRIAHTNSAESAQRLEYEPKKSAALQKNICRYGEQYYLPFEKEIGASGWKIVYFSSLSKLLEQSLSRILMPVLVVFFLEFAALVMSAHIFARIHRSLSQIVDFADHIFVHDNEVRLHLSRQDEFSVIGDSINQLIDIGQNIGNEMVEAYRSLYEAELSRKNMEMDFLQGQINPHFLYNTLACIKSIAEIRGVPEISSLALSMSNTYRYGLKANPVVSLKDELDFVKVYFSIIEIRFMNRFWLEIEADEEACSAQVFRMLLQPFVENSVLHGLERKRGGGMVKIGAVREGEILRITVEDDGVGMTAQQQEEIRRLLHQETNPEQKSIGLVNIYRRIRNAYGTDYGFRIESVEKKGCRIVITVPYIPSIPETDTEG